MRLERYALSNVRASAFGETRPLVKEAKRNVMKDAVIVSAVRTAVGKAPKGTLKNTRPDDLGAAVIREAVERVQGLDKAQVEDVIMGCAFPEAEQRSEEHTSELQSLAYLVCR